MVEQCVQTKAKTCPSSPPEIIKAVSPIPILSFFTGAGFLDLGFSIPSFQTIWRNEFNPFFVKGFSSGMCSHLKRDISIENTDSIINVGPNQIIKEAFGKSSHKTIFGVIGGPPCPDFSVGGKNRGHKGENGKLSEVYVNRILDLQPSFFLFENVPGLLRTVKHKAFFETLRNKLLSDYRMTYRVLNALEFGVPQDRERVFWIGFNRKWLKKDIQLNLKEEREDKWFPWPEPIYPNAKNAYNWPTKSPFRDSPTKPSNIPEELMVGTYINNQAEIASLPNGLEGFNPKSDKFNNVEEGDVSKKSYKRLHRWRYSPTVAYGNNEVHLHPFLPRRLTVREAMRLQTVPDTYVLPTDMPLSHKFKTIGNGVPIKLARAVALAISDFICLNGGDIL